MFVQSFSVLVSGLVIDTEAPLPGNMRDLSLLIARHKSYFESLNYYCESSHCTLDMEALEIRDVWGNKFDFYINESGEYTLLSNGQNGVSENGNGDDIVNSFSVPMLK